MPLASPIPDLEAGWPMVLFFECNFLASEEGFGMGFGMAQGRGPGIQGFRGQGFCWRKSVRVLVSQRCSRCDTS